MLESGRLRIAKVSPKVLDFLPVRELRDSSTAHSHSNKDLSNRKYTKKMCCVITES
jgi:hypothetical protein